MKSLRLSRDLKAAYTGDLYGRFIIALKLGVPPPPYPTPTHLLHTYILITYTYTYSYIHTYIHTLTYTHTPSVPFLRQFLLSTAPQMSWYIP